MIGAPAAAAIASLRPGCREAFIMVRQARRTCRSKPIIGRNLHWSHYKESFLFVEVTLAPPFGAVNTNGG
jgi:hypothetical protein